MYDRLSPSFAAYLDTLSAYHEGKIFQSLAKSSGKELRAGARGSPHNIGDALEAVHPVIRVNPVTGKPHMSNLTTNGQSVSFLKTGACDPLGWKSVFVNPAFTKRILGVTKDESDVILRWV